MDANAEILLVRKDGAVILQVRDDKPGITNPGLVSTFGGRIESGEEPLEAAVREINEETNLGLKKNQLRFYRKCRKTKAAHGEDWDVYYFVASGVSDKNLKVYEGVGYKVVRNQAELKNVKATVLLQEVLGDFFDGFRSFVLNNDIATVEAAKLADTYYDQAVQGKRPQQKRPIVLACTGLVASGKSTVCAPLAAEINAVKISADEIRELLFQAGYNFGALHNIMKRLLKRLIAARYHVFLDFNISNNAYYLESFAKVGYQIFIVHAHPPEAFIRRKILSGNMKHELTFFPKDEHLLISMEGWRTAHYQNLKKLEKQYGIWAEVDTSQPNLDKIISRLAQRFKHEAGPAP